MIIIVIFIRHTTVQQGTECIKSSPIKCNKIKTYIYTQYALKYLFHDLLLRSYLYHCVWSIITAHNLTPEKGDNNYSPQPSTATTCLRNNIRLI